MAKLTFYGTAPVYLNANSIFKQDCLYFKSLEYLAGMARPIFVFGLRSLSEIIL